MDKKGILAACITGGVILLLYVLALTMGVGYNQIYIITIIQIEYIMFLLAYATVVTVKKILEETRMEKVPVKVKDEYNDSEENHYDNY
ncbi:MAG: hypothetical protein E7262_10180 [Lachnospiraceae bacterium]|nr:hypothetical protein [Lachnospiraceae bacterium]